MEISASDWIGPTSARRSPRSVFAAGPPPRSTEAKPPASAEVLARMQAAPRRL